MNWIIDFFAIVLMCSVQGSIVFGIFSLWEKSKLTAGTVRLNYFMLKWITLLYMLPISYVIDKTIWSNGFLFQSVPVVRWICFIAGLVWLGGALYFVVNYHRQISYIKKVLIFSFPCDNAVMDVFYEVRDKLGVKGEIKVIFSDMSAAPFVCGVREVYIVLPKGGYERKALEIIFTHELIHVKQKDILWKYLIHLVKCVHWFNPLPTILLKRYDVWSESACDIRAGLVLEDWKAYFSQVLNMMISAEEMNKDFSAGLYEEDITLEERVNKVNHWRNKKRRIGIALLAAVSICAISPMSVLAAAKGYQGAYTNFVYTAETGQVYDVDNEIIEMDAADVVLQEGYANTEELENDTIVHNDSLLRSSKVPFSWTIKKKSRIMTDEFHKTKGSKFTVAVVNAGDDTIEVGLLNSDNYKYYFKLPGGKMVTYTFTIEATDDYRFYITNWNTYTITASGYYIINP